MINMISGTTAVTSRPTNSLQNKEKNNQNNANNMQNSSQNNVENEENIKSSIQAEKNAEQTDKTLEQLQKYIQKDYLERNFYIDEETKVSVMQLVNNETDKVIGQYPADLYLNLLLKVRENQKEMIDQNLNYRSTN